MLTMEQINDILCEELADDLPVAEHMMLWTADDIRKYAQEGGFWSPGAGSGDSVTDAELSRAATQISLDGGPPLGWEESQFRQAWNRWKQAQAKIPSRQLG